MLKSNFFYLFASIIAVFANEADKVETGCKPCSTPCPPKCPEATALEAARLLINNFRIAIDTNDLALIQGGITLPKSTAQFIIRGLDGCVDSGVQNLLAFMIPQISLITCTDPVITSSYVDSKGRVIAFVTHIINFDGTDVSVKSRYVFEPVDGQCEFRLVDLLVRDVTCV